VVEAGAQAGAAPVVEAGAGVQVEAGAGAEQPHGSDYDTDDPGWA
jgi:hypothetical protein